MRERVQIRGASLTGTLQQRLQSPRLIRRELSAFLTEHEFLASSNEGTAAKKGSEDIGDEWIEGVEAREESTRAPCR